MPVYFIQSGEGGPVKIGTAEDVAARLRELQCGNPETLVVLRTIEGGRAEEVACHRHFSALRIRGEWFSFAPEMLIFVPPVVAAPAVNTNAEIIARRPLARPEEIERLAAERGKSIRDVCAEAGIARTTFSRWKAGVTSPTLDVYRRIVEAVEPPSADTPMETPPQLRPEVVGA